MKPRTIRTICETMAAKRSARLGPHERAEKWARENEAVALAFRKIQSENRRLRKVLKAAAGLCEPSGCSCCGQVHQLLTGHKRK